jgi:hypothetical protein
MHATGLTGVGSENGARGEYLPVRLATAVAPVILPSSATPANPCASSLLSRVPPLLPAFLRGMTFLRCPAGNAGYACKIAAAGDNRLPVEPVLFITQTPRACTGPRHGPKPPSIRNNYRDLAPHRFLASWQQILTYGHLENFKPIPLQERALVSFRVCSRTC